MKPELNGPGRQLLNVDGMDFLLETFFTILFPAKTFLLAIIQSPLLTFESVKSI